MDSYSPLFLINRLNSPVFHINSISRVFEIPATRLIRTK